MLKLICAEFNILVLMIAISPGYKLLYPTRAHTYVLEACFSSQTNMATTERRAVALL